MNVVPAANSTNHDTRSFNMAVLKLSSKSVVLVPCRTHLIEKAWSAARRSLRTRSAFIRSAHERTRNGRGQSPCSARAVRVANVAELREGREQCSRDRLPKVEQSVSFALRPSRAH